ncbi:MAG: antibiotic biosynthesis monooxygenase [Chitinophagaceae bacterium]|uniref:putative quinol monooxygenase n=1 Tax=unclassified Paraflavitalea TaxID=2798305 RepID=UPI003D34D149|nr:antibiotic biosynthesis monooxygenase [Chitinophagaceae bacterium]
MYLLHGKLSTKEGKRDAMAEVLLEASEKMQGNGGCHLYAVSIDPEERNTVYVTEIWDSKEDHDNSLKNPEVKLMITKAMPLIEGMPQRGQELKVLSPMAFK